LPKDLENLGELLERLGGIAPHRVRLRPAPGEATEKDVLAVLGRSNRLCELVDGVLVEKVMGYPESSLALWLAHLLQQFLDEHDLGNLAGMDGTMRLMPGLVRIPDLSFVRWEKLPSREPLSEPIPNLVPDLAVEVLSEGNTPGEMQRKLREYLLAGVEVVWFVDLRTRTIEVHTAPDRHVLLTENDTLDGGNVLPGLSLPVRRIFERIPRPKQEKSAPRRSASNKDRADKRKGPRTK
jgi:Uma2 family endonuclease